MITKAQKNKIERVAKLLAELEEDGLNVIIREHQILVESADYHPVSIIERSDLTTDISAYTPVSAGGE